jgi:hypothetical protein
VRFFNNREGKSEHNCKSGGKLSTTKGPKGISIKKTKEFRVLALKMEKGVFCTNKSIFDNM